jgi:ABC-type transport system involved in Fe-S cluster assembly fused permease/ATPase subunit
MGGFHIYLASYQTTTSLALLNFGQNIILSFGLSVIMVMAAQNITAGEKHMCVNAAHLCCKRIFKGLFFKK